MHNVVSLDMNRVQLSVEQKGDSHGIPNSLVVVNLSCQPRAQVIFRPPAIQEDAWSNAPPVLLCDKGVSYRNLYMRRQNS